MNAALGGTGHSLVITHRLSIHPLACLDAQELVPSFDQRLQFAVGYTPLEHPEAAIGVDAGDAVRPKHFLRLFDSARDLVGNGARAALVKGGHLAGDPADVLATATETRVFDGPRLAGNMRGTGCVLAMSLACELALGSELVGEIENAREYVRKKIAAGTRFGSLQTAF